MRPVRIAIDARFPSGKMGGIEQFVLGLIHGLSRLDRGHEQYFLLVNEGEFEWLHGKIGSDTELLVTRKAGLRKLRAAQLFSDGTVEKAGIDVIHFTWQFAFFTSKPNIYHPHDLQHVHLPQNFSRVDRLGRSLLYRSFCKQASVVAAGTQWVSHDLTENLGVPEHKIKVVNLAPVIESYPNPDQAELDRIREKFGIEKGFIFYPAQTWPHKNHIRLIQAIGRLKRAFGYDISLVCSGAKNRDHQVRIDATVREEGLEGKVHFLGFVSPQELRALYRSSKFVCIPTMFESASFPMWEAFELGVPVACSKVTSLPAQAGGAAMLFDATDVDEMARVIKTLWENESERQRLGELGRKRVSEFTWIRTARNFRSLYRQLAGVKLSEEDASILTESPLI